LIKGYAGSLLRVDLSSRSAQREPLNERYIGLYIGGRGLGARYLLDHIVPGSDPLGVENPCIIMTGPFTGSPISSVHKFEVITRSPLTDMYLCCNVGGTFGVEMKRAGFDGLILLGRSPKPVYLTIFDGDVEFRDASCLWGRNCREVRQLIKDEVGRDFHVMCIGPAGERLVRFANIMSEPERSAGKGGAGAVWGSKNLKAVAVKGSGSIDLSSVEEVKECGREVLGLFRGNPATAMNFPRWGTCQFTSSICEMGLYPFRNFQSVFTDAQDKIDGETWRKGFVTKDTAPCHICSVGCGKISEVRGGPYNGCSVEGPEYETLWALGPNCGIVDCEVPIVANAICDELGLDTISTGVTIAFAMECYERGLISEAEVGMPLRFGDGQALLAMIRKIGFREDLGDRLAEGVRRFSSKVGRGSERFAMHCKGMELPAYDPRGAWGMGLSYATSCRGGDHLKAWTISDEITSGKYDRFSTEGKAELVKRIQDTRSTYDSLVNCVLAARAITMDVCSRLMKAITGREYSVSTLMRCGERIYNLERAIAAIDGISAKDDVLPTRIVEEPLDAGPAAGRIMGRENLEKMLKGYYELRGWNANGLPTTVKLMELDMQDVIEIMRQKGVRLSG